MTHTQAGRSDRESAAPLVESKSTGRRKDLLVLCCAIAIWALWYRQQASEMYFMADIWAHLGDADYRPEDLLAGHGGHWVAWNVLVTNVLFDTAGLNYWPWWGVLRIVAWGGMAIWTWWLIGKRGGSRLVALAAAGLMLVMPIALVFRPWLIGIPIEHVVWTSASLMMDGQQTNRRRFALFGLLVFGVTTGSLIVLFAVASLGLALIGWDFRYWWPSLVGSLVVRMLWASFGPAAQPKRSSFGFADVVRAPYAVLRLFKSGIDNWLLLPGLWTAAVASGVVLGLLVCFVAGGRERHVLRGIGLLAVTLGATYISRVVPGIASVETPRYAMPIAIILLLTVAPTLRFDGGRVRQVGAIGFVILAIVAIPDQRRELIPRYRYENNVSSALEAELAATVDLLRAGHPHSPSERFRPGALAGGALTFGRIAILADTGRLPSGATEADLDKMRAEMLFDIRAFDASAEVRCAPADPEIAFDVETSVIVVRGGEVGLVWRDVAGVSGMIEHTLADNESASISALAIGDGELLLRSLSPSSSLFVCEGP